jgi:hypothetical protein
MGPVTPARPKNPARRKTAGRRPAAKPARTKPAPARTAARRADLGAPIDGFLSRQPPALRAIVDALRAMVLEAAPEATSALKWGMPFFSVGGELVCAVSAHKAHVNLVLPGAPGTFDDPGGLLEGEGKTGQHLKVRALDELPRTEVRRWLGEAAARARAGSR